jgi:hypothetical protein
MTRNIYETKLNEQHRVHVKEVYSRMDKWTLENF